MTDAENAVAILNCLKASLEQSFKTHGHAMMQQLASSSKLKIKLTCDINDTEQVTSFSWLNKVQDADVSVSTVYQATPTKDVFDDPVQGKLRYVLDPEPIESGDND